CMQGLDLYSF
nr:immunoglobulin light chain junction region [Macaca mulatta]